MKTYRRIFALMLALLLVCPLWPGKFSAPLGMRASAFSGGRGELGDPYLIATSSDFNELVTSGDTSKAYRQTGNFSIDHRARLTKPFSGTYDGNGFTITVNNSNLDNVNQVGGVFQEITASALVENLNVHMNAVSISGIGNNGNNYFGGIAGKNYGTITNCAVTGTMQASVAIKDQYVTVGTQYDALDSWKSQLMVGGIAGLTGNNAKITGCYSSVTLYVGSDTRAKFQGQYERTGGNLYKDCTARYMLYAGGIVGELNKGGTIESCLAEDVTIYMGNAGANGKVFSNATTYAAAGGILGLEWGGVAPVVKNNVRRGGNINANLSSGYSAAAALIGFVQNDTKTDDIANNYTDAYDNTDARLTTNKGRAFYKQSDILNINSCRGYDDGCTKSSNPTADQIDLGKWVDGVHNLSNVAVSKYATTLKWLTTPAPTGALPANPENGSAITLTPPTYTPPLINTKNRSANDINYTLTYTTQGQLATPTAEITHTNATDYTLVITAPEGYMLKGSSTDSNDTSVGSLPAVASPIKIHLGGSGDNFDIEYYAKSHDPAATKKDSYTVTITVSGTGENATVTYTNAHASENEGPGTCTKAVSGVTTESGVEYGGTMTLTFDKDIKPGSKIELKAWMEGTGVTRPLEYVVIGTTGGATAAPSITPGSSGNLGNGITIKAGSGATIYYTLDGSDPARSDNANRKIYTTIPWESASNPNDSLSMIFTGNSLTIKAAAEVGAVISAVSEITYTVANKPQAAAPDMRISNALFSSNTYYPAGSEVAFLHSDIAAGNIYYTTDGTTPTENNGIKYDPADAATHYKLLLNKSTVTINATLVRTNYPNSQIYSAVIHVLSKHGAPLYSLENNAKIPIGQKLSFMLSPDDLPAQIRPNYYMKEGESRIYMLEEVLNERGNYYGVLEINDNPNFNYEQYSSNIPTIYYQLDSGIERTYNPGTPEIRFLTDGQLDDTKTKKHTAATEVVLSGQAGSLTQVNAWLKTNNGNAFESGDIATNSFTFYTAVATPKASPAAADDNLTTLTPGTKVSLSCATSGAKIFYSLTGMPSVNYSSDTGVYTCNPGTEEYAPLSGITVSGTAGGYFTIYAGAVKDGMSESGLATFVYKISDLNIVEAPTATPTTSVGNIATVEEGSRVILVSATSGAQIFYSFTGTPVVNKNGSNYTAGAGTSLLVPSKGITVSGSAGTFFTIHAVAVKDGMTDSPVVTFTYQLPAPVQAVYATPGEGSVVKGTEVALSTTTAGATIFYETAARERDIEDPIPNESQVYTKPIKIEERTYITAIAVKNGVESIITEYAYTVASTVGAPEPSISSGSVVAKGTKVSFTSSTGGASFTYTKDGSDPADEKNTKRMYGSEIAIDAEEGKSVSISIYAHKTGMTPSQVVSVSYTVSKSGDVMTANPAADSTVKPGDRITLSTSVTGTEIYYTTDGSEPTRESQKGSTVTVDGAYGEVFTIRAVAATETTITAPYVFSYNVVARTPAPSASIPGGATILEGATVTLTAPEGNIYYTTDGSEPTSSSQMYTEAFKLTGSTVLKAIAVADNKAQSQTVEYIYTMAGQVAAPTASLPSGTINVGSKIELSSTTEGATIYYTTNGVAPTTDNLRDCFTCEGSIIISRPVSIRMFAVKQGMNDSVVNTVTYTVAYPVEDEEDQDASAIQWNTDRLFLFDQFVDSGEGPLFEDVVLRDNLTLTVVSAAGDALPEGVQLMVVHERSPSAEDEDAVTRALEMKLGALYNIRLVGQNSEDVQPLTDNSVEVGLPIPEGYEDTIVLICRINDNGTVTAFPTRRSAGMLYAVVDHFSKYAVAVPPPLETKESWFKLWYLWPMAAGTAMAVSVLLPIVIAKKRKKAKASES